MQTLLTQTCQTALCNRLHLVDQRLARWLLTARHAVQSDDLELTQERGLHASSYEVLLRLAEAPGAHRSL